MDQKAGLISKTRKICFKFCCQTAKK